ncbi:creatininase family protein [Bowmanella dokdonensis]|uniref:Creatininase family protein n=1 Tax=Bowmanella dokdonensis TaxID=751969 RepID=A0A939DNS6_9ALTE|nr:creatininase family protein [Bowmanella dokdonensis]MBN7825995.1 creatininase family protein [Bowmanella dokdonensis]
MKLVTASWMEIDSYLTQSKSILIPIGSIEQHGPNGLLGTDALCPEIIAGEAESLTPMLIGPTFSVGCAQHHLGFAGTITLRPSTMIQSLVDWVASLRRHGFERLYFLNGHGGNVATIQAAFAEIYAGISFSAEPPAPLELKLQNWWQLPGVAELCREIYPQGDGMHATASEVAVTYAAYPQAQKQVSMSPRIAPTGRISHAHAYRERFADGRIGSDPAQASVEAGEKIIARAAESLVREYASFDSGQVER